MNGGFIAFRCCNFENTVEREQFRFLCHTLMNKYAQTNELCLLIANYNIFDSEFDSILIKQDAIIALEYKNYGGKVIATDNGEWTADGQIIKGGSRKTVYQQARMNHAALRNGLREVGINNNWIKDLPTLIVFNQDIILDNQLSGKVKSWLHITDNSHFGEKVEDITCKSTYMSNSDILDLAIKLNLSPFIDMSLSKIPELEPKTKQNEVAEEPKTDNLSTSEETPVVSYNRKTPNHIFNLRPNQIFVFGTDRRGSQRYGAAGLAAKRFGAQIGVVEGKTGMCYALPTRGFTEKDLENSVERFKQYVKANTQFTYLVTAVGCGHAGFNVVNVANMFKELIDYSNVMLPEQFLDVYKQQINESTTRCQIANKKDPYTAVLKYFKDELHNVVRYLLEHNIPFNHDEGYVITEADGSVVAEAELGIETEKIVFNPINSQSKTAFMNNGYAILTPDEYFNTKKL